MEKLDKFALATFLQIFSADRKGVTAIEYGLIAGLIAVAIIAAITLLGTSLGNLFNTVNNSVTSA